MAKKPHTSQPPHGQGPSRHKGTEQHGWSPDVDETRQQDNPSAHRSFHTAEHGGGKGPGRTKSKEETKPVPGDTVESGTTRGEEYADKDEKGRMGHGTQGPLPAPQRHQGRLRGPASTPRTHHPDAAQAKGCPITGERVGALGGHGWGDLSGFSEVDRAVLRVE